MGSASACTLTSPVARSRRRTSLERESWSRRASGVPSATIRPPARMSSRSAIFSASARSCVVMSTVVSRSARSATRSCTSRRPAGSSPVVGSSRKSTSGRPTSPMATSSRRR
ncbi:hypothetical protein BJF86_15895 [Serinicoccus sp. CNJ-927]|nr:hypothetical protein BJF86_15895 [Serinicoccus sp. CNJ-927]